MTRSLPATISLPPSSASILATRMNLLASRAVLRIAQHEAFLVVADGGADDLGRDGEKRLVERTHQHDRPFDQPGHLGQQAGILHQLVALGEGEVLGVGQDDLPAPLRVEHDLGLFELGGVVLEPAHLERLRRHEAVAARLVAGRDAVDREGDDVGVFGLRPEGGDDGMQRPHPAERAGLGRALAPPHRLRPGERPHHLGHELADHLDGRPARLLDHRHVEVALLVGLDRGLLDRLEPGGAHEALDRAGGGADARTFLLLLHVGLPDRHALHREREAARGDEGLGALINETRIDQPVGDQLAQVLGRARLHARGNFLGKQFEQKVGHGGHRRWFPQVAGAGRAVKPKSVRLHPGAQPWPDSPARWCACEACRGAANSRRFARLRWRRDDT